MYITVKLFLVLTYAPHHADVTGVEAKCHAFLTTALFLMGGEGLASRPDALHPRKGTRCTLDKRLGGSWSRKILFC
jgi:hypothetical protein